MVLLALCASREERLAVLTTALREKIKTDINHAKACMESAACLRHGIEAKHCMESIRRQMHAGA